MSDKIIIVLHLVVTDRIKIMLLSTAYDPKRRGWWASVVFMLMVVGLIIFLSYVEIQEKNRDILIGIIGMLTGSISSMLAIASGRDPSEISDLKDKLSVSNADRIALITRLRDNQIQLQLKNAQIFELQSAILRKMGVSIATVEEEDVQLHKDVEAWLPVEGGDNEES